MNYIRQVVDWIVSLESGGQFRKWVSILVKIFGVLSLIVAIVAGLGVLVAAIEGVNGGWGSAGTRVLMVIGAIFSLAISLVTGVIFLMLCWKRSSKIRNISEESYFTLIPIVVILIRLFGEGGFISFIGTGAQALVASIFGSRIGFWRGLAYNFDLPRDMGFIAGVISLVGSVLIGAIILIFAYFIAEQMNLLVDMATNLKKIEARSLLINQPMQGGENET